MFRSASTLFLIKGTGDDDDDDDDDHDDDDDDDDNCGFCLSLFSQLDVNFQIPKDRSLFFHLSDPLAQFWL
mgnify:CR=1 FL=1